MADDADVKQKSQTGNFDLLNNWPDQAADVVVNTVDKVRNATTGPVVSASRILAYVIFGIFPLLIALILSIMATVRGLEIATGRAWAAHGILGVAFISLGLFFWSKRPNHPA